MMVNLEYSLPMPWIWAAFLLAGIATIDLSEGQRTEAVCIGSDWNWTFNSKNQSPCLVAAYLLAPCEGGQYNVPKLPAHLHYTPPNETNADRCLCSSVVYSLLSACGGCQMDTPINETDPPPKWSEWHEGCASSMVYVSMYPNNISSATAVPAWAYLDVVTADTFNPVSASRDVGLPESTVGNPVKSTPSSTPSSISSSNNSNGTAIIIGVTVGGLIGLIITAVIIFYLVKRHKSRLSSAGTSATPNMAAAGLGSAPQHPNTLLSGVHSNSSQGQSGTPLPPGVFQFEYTGSPWSPPPPSSTPSRAMSPTSAQSLLSTHNYGSLWGRGDDGMDYRNSTSAESPGSITFTTTPPVHGYGAGNGQGGSGPTQSRRFQLPEM